MAGIDLSEPGILCNASAAGHVDNKKRVMAFWRFSARQSCILGRCQLSTKSASFTENHSAATSATIGASLSRNPTICNQPKIIRWRPSLSLLIPAARQPYDTVESVLGVIGRNCASHADKFSSWSDLFSTTSEKLKKLGIPVRERKWLLQVSSHLYCVL
jgi:hypothetical protein